MKTTSATETTAIPGSEEEKTEYLVYAAVAEEVDTSLREGRDPDVETMVAEHPELATHIRELVPTLVTLHQLGHDVGAEAATGPAKAARGRAPGQLGDYRIIREIGRGGMGVVYEAEQVSLGRRVALKVLPFAAVLDQRQLQRFKNEAHAAAQLHHTNIVPVYAVGCERGVHFYAMQYIEGQTLAAVVEELSHISDPKVAEADEPPRLLSDQTRSLSSGRWAPPERSGGDSAVVATVPAAEGSSGAVQVLASEYSTKSPAFFRSVANLGIQAAEGLDHAHESGVLHRDIKPSNLLLDARGHLWITDFGLAHVESDPGLTMTGDILGTVRYMSPEQALAKRILVDHRTDIYSLGVTLYELLTLQPAFTGRDRQELLRQIAFEEPRLPRRVNSAIPTELETIVLKAVNKNPEQRYATAQDLADDLERFLDDKPIKAKRPTLIERVAKWSRRHRAVVASGVVLLIVAVVALSVSTALIWQEQGRTQHALDQAQEQRGRAEANFQLASEAVDQMLTRVAEELKDQPHMEQVRRELLEDALAFYERFLEQEGNDPAVRYETGRAYGRVGYINRTLGDDARAEETYRKAVAIFEDLAADSDEPKYVCTLADAYENLGNLLCGRTTPPPQFSGPEEPVQVYRKAVALREPLVTEFPDNLHYGKGLAGDLANLGRALRQTGQLEEAEEATRQGLAILEQLAPELSDEPKYRSALAMCHQNLGVILGEMGRKAEQESACRQAVALHEELVLEFPEKRDYRDGLAGSLSNLAILLRGTDPRAEEEAVRRAMELYEQLAADFPDVPWYKEHLANTHNTLTKLLVDTQRVEEAEQVYRQWAAIYEELIADFPNVPEYRGMLASIQTNLGLLLGKTGRKAEEEAAYRQAIALAEQLTADFPGDPEYADSFAIALNNLGYRLTGSDRSPEAEDALIRAVALAERLVTDFPGVREYSDHLLDFQVNFAKLLAGQGRLEEAQALLEQAVPHRQVGGRGYNELAWILATSPHPQLRNPIQAVELAELAVELAPQNGSWWNTLGVARYRAGDWPGAIEALTRSMDLRPGAARVDDWFFLAMSHWRLGDREQAHQWYKRAVDWMEKKKGWPDLQRWHAEAAELLRIDEPPTTAEQEGPSRDDE